MTDFAIGIKNSIIFLLVILIAYFFLKNQSEQFTSSLNVKGSLYDVPNKGQTTCKKLDLHIPLSTTCDADIQNIPDTAMVIKEDCQIEQTKDIMIINKYEDEKKMNSTDQEVGADAYDEYDSYFQLYKA